MLSLTYLILALAGCGYILIAAFLGHLFDFSDAGHVGHGGHGGDHGGEHAGHGQIGRASCRERV